MEELLSTAAAELQRAVQPQLCTFGLSGLQSPRGQRSRAGAGEWVKLFFAASGGKRESDHKCTHISPWSLLTSTVQQLMKEGAVTDLKFPLNPAAHEYFNHLYSFEDCCSDSWLLHEFVRDSKSSV